MRLSECRGLAAAAAFAAICSGCSSQSASTESSPPSESAAPAPPVDPGGPGSVTGKVPAARGGFPSIVILESQMTQEFPPQAGTPVMDQVSLSFIPGLLLVRTGQPVEFRNSDDVLHNVRVREEATKAPSFNVAIPTGQVYAHTFPRDGFYDVGCDIHPGMAAQIVATSTPYATTTDAEGNFVLRDVLPGSYTVTVYAGADRIDQPLEVGAGRTEVHVVPR